MRDLRYQLEPEEIRDLEHRFQDVSLATLLRVVSLRAVDWNRCAVGERLQLTKSEKSRGFYEIKQEIETRNYTWAEADKIATKGNLFGHDAEHLENLYYEIQRLFRPEEAGESGETADKEASAE